MPSKLGLADAISVSTNTVPLIFNNTTGGYLNGNMHLNGSGQLVIGQSKLYYIGIAATVLQNGSSVVNTANLKVYVNGVNSLEFTKSYNENDETTLFVSAYIPLNAGDIISSDINFANLSPGKIFVLAVPTETFLNVV